MDGKKKKNRKKKGNQNKVAEDSNSNAEEVVVPEQSHCYAAEKNYTEQNHCVQDSANVDGQSVGVSESDREQEKHKICEAQCIKLHKEVKQLVSEKDLWLQKQVSLEEKMKNVENEVDSCSQKEASLEEKIKTLQNEVDSCCQREVLLEDRVKHIEGAQDSWTSKEISIKEMIAKVAEVNLGLQTQVKELEESRNIIIQENQRLVESISGLEMRLQRLEREASFYDASAIKIPQLPEEKDSGHQIEAAREIEMPVSENAELGGKVPELYIGPDQHADTAEPDHVMTPASTHIPLDHASDSGQIMSESGEKTQSSVETHETPNTDNGIETLVADTGAQHGQPPGLDEARIIEDIVTVPLDEIQIHEEDSQVLKHDEKSEGIPLSDAPLIGAPFRLISFFAKYVSGADLVDQNNSKPGR